MTTVAELPADQRAVLVAYGQDGPEWARVRVELKEDPRRARWLCENLVLELFRAYDVAQLSPIGERRGPFERARDELCFFGEEAVPVLVELLRGRDGVMPVVASDVLRRIGEPAIGPVAATLDCEDPRARRSAAELLGDLPHAGQGEDAVEQRLGRLAAEDPEWLVRAQAARSLGLRGVRHSSPDVARTLLQPVLADPDPAVAREAALALQELGDPAAVPALLNYLERSVRAGDPRSEQAAQEALQALTGDEGTRDPRAWRDFWREHRGDLLEPTADRSY
jgi:HEAT repeat protein